jgi:prepilin peptidase CpaA
VSSRFSEHLAIHAVQWTVIVLCSLIAAITDLRSRRIPNALTGPMFLAGLAWSTWSAGVSGFGDAFLASIALAAPYIVLFLIAGGGAADAKLMGAVGAWVGLHQGAMILICVCVSGAVIGVAYSVLRGRAAGVFYNLLMICTAMISLIAGRRTLREVAADMPDSRTMLCIPYGLAIFAGVCVAAVGMYLTNIRI